MKNLELGSLAKDRITGLKGILIAHCKYLSGCDQYCIKPPVDKDGKMPDGQWFDETDIVILGKGINKLSKNDKGGPHSDAPRM